MRPPMNFPLSGKASGGGDTENLLLDFNAENWIAETGTIPENPDTVAVTSAKVLGWNYGAETLPLLSYQFGSANDIIEVDRNGAGGSNFETDDPVTGLIVGQWVYIKPKVELNTNNIAFFWQTSAQGNNNQATAIAGSTGTGILDAIARNTATSHYPGMRCTADANGEFQLDYLRAYTIVAENVGEGSGENGDTAVWDVTGMPVAPTAAANTPPVGWSFGSATPLARAVTGSSNPAAQWIHSRNSAASADDAYIKRDLTVSVGDVIHIRYTIAAASGNTRVDIFDGVATTTTATTGTGTHTLTHTAGATTVTVRALPTTLTGTTTWGEFNIVVIPASRRVA